MAKERLTKRKRVVCSIVIVLSVLLIIFAFCGRFFNSALKDIANFFVGSFGMAFYGMLIASIVVCSFLLAGKTLLVPKKYVAHFCVAFVEVVLLVHMFSTYFIFDAFESFEMYAKYVYNYYSGVPTFGGIVFGSVAYGLQKVVTIFGASVLLFGLLAWSVYEIGDFFHSYFTGKLNLTKPHHETTESPAVDTTPVQPMPVEDEHSRAMRILFEQSLSPQEVHYDTAPQSTFERQEAANILFNQPAVTETTNDFFGSNVVEETVNDEMSVGGFTEPTEQPVVEQEWRATPTVAENTEPVGKPKPDTIFDEVEDGGWVQSIDIVDVVTEETSVPQPNPAPKTQSAPAVESTMTDTVTFDFEEEPSLPNDDIVFIEESSEFEEESVNGDEIVAVEKGTVVPGGIQVGFDFCTQSDLETMQKKVHKYPKYIQPPEDLLNDVTVVEDNDSEYRQKATQAIINKLAVFGIKIEAVEPVVGPTVTQYRFRVLSERTRMSDFNRYGADLKACLEAQDDIRIEAPIEGTNLVGIEAANKVRHDVVLRSLLDSKELREKKGALVFAIGQEISGRIIVTDLAKLPHLLVAGTTGSGKSVFLHSMIATLMYRYSPEYLRFVMVDPKFVELSRYNGIPHMLTTETITNATDALGAMDYLVSEMESRYQLFRAIGATNITDYNAKINPNLVQKLPYLVLIVDELADLMAACGKNFESRLQRIAQKSRAAGIHIVLATQRPDVKTITGTIKANLPARIALKVSSATDSGTILNGGGAEKLLGKGDMLFMDPSKAGLTRAQCAYVTDEEIFAIVEFVKSQNEVYYDTSISDEIFVSRQQPEQTEEVESEPTDEKVDPYCKKALRFWLERQGGRASIASIQRALKIGFNRAGRIMDTLQKLHYVEELAPNESSTKPLKVLVTLEELDSLFPDLED